MKRRALEGGLSVARSADAACECRLEKVLPRRFRCSVATRPAVRVGLPSAKTMARVGAWLPWRAEVGDQGDALTQDALLWLRSVVGWSGSRITVEHNFERLQDCPDVTTGAYAGRENAPAGTRGHDVLKMARVTGGQWLAADHPGPPLAPALPLIAAGVGIWQLTRPYRQARADRRRRRWIANADANNGSG